MQPRRHARVLVVANRTAAAPRLGLADKAMDMTRGAYHAASRGSGPEDR